MPAPNKQIAWGAIAGTIIGGVAVALVVNFAILPARDRMRERTELARTVDRHELRIANIEAWQADMIRWRERVVAATGTVGMRHEFKSMPAPAPVDTTKE